MQKVQFGNTGFEVSRLGVGLSEIGSLELSDQDQATNVLNTALDNGINFLDTSACYGISEELVGNGDVIRALQEAQQAGKTRFIGYSGDNEAAHWAVDSGLFATLQTSYNLVEQRARTSGLLEKAIAKGMGTIIKRPIAGGVWGKSRPDAPDPTASGYNTPYLERAKSVRATGPIENEPDDAILTSLGYTLSDPNADVAIVGTTNPSHMATNISQVDNGLPIPDSVIEELNR